MAEQTVAQWVVQVAFVALAVKVALDWRRLRDRTTWYATLVFGAFAVSILAGWFERAVPQQSHWPMVLGSCFVMLHPWLLLRLVDFFWPAARIWHVIASVGAALSVMAILVFGPGAEIEAGGLKLPPMVTALLVAYFAVIEAIATLTMVRGARRSSGITRRRLRLAVYATTCLVVLFVLALIPVGYPALRAELDPWLQLLALLSAGFYFCAFVPPARLRHHWQNAELARLVEHAQQTPTQGRGELLLASLSERVREALDALTVVLIRPGEEPGTLVTAGVDPAITWSLDSDAWVARCFREGETQLVQVSDLTHPPAVEWCQQQGAEFTFVVPLSGHGGAVGVVWVLLSERPLFVSDDLALAELMAGQTGIWLENSQLLSATRRMAAELETRNAELEKASRHKSDFVSNMSHELRTPLNAIIGFAELLHSGRVGEMAPQHKEFIGDVLTSSRHLLQLINDVLDLTKIEAGRVHLRPRVVDPRLLVREVLEVLRGLAAAKDLTVTTDLRDSPEEVTVDPSKYKQILYNYVSNAIKFTPEGGRVEVRIAECPEGRFVTEVTDDGIGIDGEDLPRLFHVFEQLDSGHSKRFQGTGLGLALTRRLAEAMGGSVTVRSAVGEGSCFGVLLDKVHVAVDETAALSHASAGSPPETERRRILVVEDNVADAGFLRDTLADAGFDVTVRQDGQEAIDLASHQRFDAITLDLLLPDVAGLTVLNAIRKLGPNRTTPVVVVSVSPDPAVVRVMPVTRALRKPVAPKVLVGALEQAVTPVSSSRRIVVVDDDPSARKLMRTVLEAVDYEVHEFERAAPALAALTELDAAAVILDLSMPEMDGYEFLDRFRQTPAALTTPVLVWTAATLTDDELAELGRWARAVVPKGPGASQALIDLLVGLIEREASHVSGSAVST